MFKRTQWIFSIILFWSSTLRASILIQNSSHITNACYGVYNNMLKLHCKYPKVINNVNQMIYAAKPNKQGCPQVMDESHFKKDCCTLEPDDCRIPKMNENFFVSCIGESECQIRTTWMAVGNKCDPKLYSHYTSFMAVEYQCGMLIHKKASTTQSTTNQTPLIRKTDKITDTQSTMARMPRVPKIDKTIDNSNSLIHSVITTVNTQPKQTSSKVNPENKTKKPDTGTTRKYGNSSVASPRSSSIGPLRAENETPTIMLGTIIAITCGVVGMLLSVLCLLIYCRSKKQSTPDPDNNKLPSTNFWNNILTQSLTTKTFVKGYNNFTSFMPSRYPVLDCKDGQHAQILRSSSDASQSELSVSSTTNQTNDQTSPPDTPSTSHSPRDPVAPFAFTIVNNLTP